MNTILHPATDFVQNLSFDEVQFKNLTQRQQVAMLTFMYAEGDGIWAANGVKTLNMAINLYGDIRFGVGKFKNDDTMKIAFVESTPGIEPEDPVKWFDENCICADEADTDASDDAPPVILNRADIAAEFGLLEDGHDAFYDFWSSQPETEFLLFLPDWNPNDETGRGGQIRW